MNVTKVCPCCKRTRPLDAFALRNKGSARRQSWCRSCIAQANYDRRIEARGAA